MIYRGVRMTGEEIRKKGRRDIGKAIVIGFGVVALIAAVVVLSGRLGLR